MVSHPALNAMGNANGETRRLSLASLTQCVTLQRSCAMPRRPDKGGGHPLLSRYDLQVMTDVVAIDRGQYAEEARRYFGSSCKSSKASA